MILEQLDVVLAQLGFFPEAGDHFRTGVFVHIFVVIDGGDPFVLQTSVQESQRHKRCADAKLLCGHCKEVGCVHARPVKRLGQWCGQDGETASNDRRGHDIPEQRIELCARH